MTRRPALTDDQIVEACELREAGRTFPAIVAHFAERGVEVGQGQLEWACLLNGADLPVARRQPHAVPTEPVVVTRGNHQLRRFTQAEDRQLLALAAEGRSRAAIGRSLGRGHNSIIGRLATLARRDARAEEMPGHYALHPKPEHEGVVS